MKKIRLGNGAATNSLLLTFVSVVTTLLGMVVAKLLSVNFSLQEYGTYSQALLVSSTLTSVCALGLSNATNFFFNKTEDRNEQGSYVSTIIAVECIAGGICAAGVIFLHRQLVNYFDNDELTWALYLVAFTPMLSTLISIFQTLFISIKKAKIIAIRNFVISVLRLMAVAVACFVTKNILTVLLIILILDVAQIFYYALLFEKNDKRCIRVFHVNFSLVKVIFHFSIPLSVYSITATLNRDIDKYVVSALSDTETLAIYSNAAKILPFDLITASFITVLIPVITRFVQSRKLKEAKDVFRLYLRIGYTATFIFVGGAIALAENVMLFLYDDKYLPGLPVFIVYLVIDMLKFANVTTILTAAGKTRSIMVVSCCTLAANAVFNMAAYKAIGMIGPALVTFVLSVVNMLVFLHLGSKELETNIVGFFNMKELLLTIAEIIVAGVIVHYLSVYMQSVGLSNVLILVVCYGGYLIVLFMINKNRLTTCLRQLNLYK